MNIQRYFVGLMARSIILVALAACAPAPTPTAVPPTPPSDESVPSTLPPPSPSPFPTATASPTATPSPSPTATNTPPPSATATESATATRVATATATPVENLLGTGPYVQDSARGGLLPPNTAPEASIADSGAAPGHPDDKNINGVEILRAFHRNSQLVGEFVFYTQDGNGPYYFYGTMSDKWTEGRGIGVAGNVPGDGRVSFASLSQGALVVISVNSKDLEEILSNKIGERVITVYGGGLYSTKYIKPQPLPSTPAP